MSGSLRSLARRAFATAAAHPVAAAPKAPYARMALRAMATGPAASAVKISDELLEKLGSLSTQALIDGLWVMGWPTSHIMGARPLTEGQKKMVGRAVTIQFAATRPDIAADKPGGTESPEYEAFELVNGKEVIVMSSVGPWESVGGDIKFLRLHQNGVRPARSPSPGAIEACRDRVFSTRPVAFATRRRKPTSRTFAWITSARFYPEFRGFRDSSPLGGKRNRKTKTTRARRVLESVLESLKRARGFFLLF